MRATYIRRIIIIAIVIMLVIVSRLTWCESEDRRFNKARAIASEATQFINENEEVLNLLSAIQVRIKVYNEEIAEQIKPGECPGIERLLFTYKSNGLVVNERCKCGLHDRYSVDPTVDECLFTTAEAELIELVLSERIPKGHYREMDVWEESTGFIYMSYEDVTITITSPVIGVKELRNIPARNIEQIPINDDWCLQIVQHYNN